MYRAVDALLLRAAHYRVDADLPAWPATAIPGSDGVESWRMWLRQVWSDGVFAEAVRLASPVLAERVDAACAQTGGDPRRLRRTVTSVARYLLRMTGRSTPFGLFAGVAAARFGPEPAAVWTGAHRAVVRADAAWLTSVVAGLEDCPQLLRRLPVVANTLCEETADRLVLSLREPTPTPSDQPDQANQTTLRQVSIRRSRVVDVALRYAQQPITLSDLVEKLVTDFPRTPPGAVEATLRELVRHGLLLTGLRPPMTATDPLGQVVRQLRQVQAATIPSIAERVRGLFSAHDAVRAHNEAAAPVGRRWARRMGQVTGDPAAPVMVDLRLDVQVTVPTSVARDAEAAAAALTRLTPYPHGMPAWQQFHMAFLERYGPDAVVPLLDLVDPGTGLGFPATYRGSDYTEPADGASVRDRRLLALVQEATLAGRDEIILDEATVADLASDAPELQPPPHVELFVQLHADTVTALRRGRYTLLVTGAARAAGATTGRFMDLLDPPDAARFHDAYARMPTSRAGAEPVQVSGAPLLTRSQNVARCPAVLPRVVPLGEYREAGEHLLPASDLAVGADASGLYLMSRRGRRLVEPTVFNAVEFRHLGHPLVRFLCEVSRARAGVYMPFSWGAASRLPVLPRVRLGRVVLSPARWNLSAADLPGPGGSWPQWCAGLAAWQQRHQLPDRVYVVEADNLLPLDLGQDLHRTMLRTHLDRWGHARLDEAPQPDAFGWIGGHSHEITVPLAATVPPRPAPAHLATTRPVRRGDAQLPGVSPWLFVKLYGPGATQLDVLTHLAADLAGWDPPVPWWFVPYRDPQPHLRVRLRLPDPAAYGPAAHRIGAWAAVMRDHGMLHRLQLDTYQPETGRYGHADAMAAAETVFAADSAAVLAQRQLVDRSGADAQAVTVAALVDLAIAFVGDTTDGMGWLSDQPQPPSTHFDRAARDRALRLADPSEDWATLRAVPGGDSLLTAWRRRRVALADYRQALAAQRDPSPVLPSLLHLHHIRMFGIDPDQERRSMRLVRAAALRWHATTSGAVS